MLLGKEGGGRNRRRFFFLRAHREKRELEEHREQDMAGIKKRQRRRLVQGWLWTRSKLIGVCRVQQGRGRRPPHPGRRRHQANLQKLRARLHGRPLPKRREYEPRALPNAGMQALLCRPRNAWCFLYEGLKQRKSLPIAAPHHLAASPHQVQVHSLQCKN